MRSAIPLALLLAVMAAPATAACYADYKAKQDGPLRLHYGVIELPANQCTAGSAAAALQARLGNGWKLLEVVSVFGDEGLEQRRVSAGEYFLRY